jgi:predicted  nucleic acid-binding Zn-ribbon protein
MRIDCHKCRYYFVTWNQQFPHGCRAMGFKSDRYPIDEVRGALNEVRGALNEMRGALKGADCLLYEPKRKGIKKGPRRD